VPRQPPGSIKLQQWTMAWRKHNWYLLPLTLLADASQLYLTALTTHTCARCLSSTSMKSATVTSSLYLTDSIAVAYCSGQHHMKHQ
jgi:hypothetical protein